MRLQPVHSHSHIHFKRNIQNIGIFHFSFNNGFDLFQLRLEDIKHQFIMYLQQHPGLVVALSQFFMNIDHRQLDDVGRTSLDGRIDGVPFRGASYYLVLGVDVPQVAAAA